MAAEAFFMARAEAKEMVLSVRAIFLVLVYFVVAGGAGWLTLKVDEKLDGQLKGLATKVTELSVTERASIIEELTKNGMPDAVVDAFMGGGLPLLLLIVLYSSTFVIPGLILLVGFNRISGDIGSRFTRYVLQRVHRESYLVGKIIGHWLVCTLAVLVVHGLLLGLAHYYEVFDHARILAAMPRIWLGMALFTLAYVTYTQLFSSLFSQPFLSLLFGIMGIFGIKLVTFVLSFFYAPLGQIWLGDWDVRLWALDPAAIAVFGGYSVAFFALSLVVLRRRDV